MSWRTCWACRSLFSSPLQGHQDWPLQISKSFWESSHSCPAVVWSLSEAPLPSRAQWRPFFLLWKIVYCMMALPVAAWCRMYRIAISGCGQLNTRQTGSFCPRLMKFCPLQPETHTDTVKKPAGRWDRYERYNINKYTGQVFPRILYIVKSWVLFKIALLCWKKQTSSRALRSIFKNLLVILIQYYRAIRYTLSPRLGRNKKKGGCAHKMVIIVLFMFVLFHTLTPFRWGLKL